MCSKSERSLERDRLEKLAEKINVHTTSGSVPPFSPVVHGNGKDRVIKYPDPSHKNEQCK